MVDVGLTDIEKIYLELLESRRTKRYSIAVAFALLCQSSGAVDMVSAERDFISLD